MKSVTSFILVLFISILTISKLYAIPAYPYPVKLKQPDGSEIMVRMRGDEFFHYKTSLDGYVLVPDRKGILTYARQDVKGRLISTGMKASNIEKRTAAEKQLVRTLPQKPDFTKQIQSMRLSRSTISRSRVATSVPQARKSYPLAGTPKSLVILVNFKDVNFSVPSSQTAFTNLLNQKGYSANGATGSARDYFTDNSKNVFSPQFDVVGPFTLPQNMEYYGKNDIKGNDSLVVQMIVDACKLADANGVDFSQYDTDGDKYVDNVFVYYAGYNEAEHAPANTVWPHRWAIYPTSIYSRGNYSGSSASITFDGKTVMDYACTSELKGSYDTNMCGIGTFCHEFSHVLGLPDFYATNDENHHTLSFWDIMDSGPYLNKGRTPPAYSSYERFYLNWLKPIEITTSQNVELDTLASSNKALIITQNGNHNLVGSSPNPIEFFMLENRQKKGWDAFLPGHGMLITHIYYNSSTWDANTPNDDPNTMGVDIVEADKVANDASLSGDTYPGTDTIKSFTPVLRSGMKLDKPLTDITENKGIITFRFMGNPELKAEGILKTFTTVHGTPAEIQTINVSGKKLESDIKFSFEKDQHFKIKKETDTNWYDSLCLSPTDSVISNVKIQIQYNPTEPSYQGTHNETLYLKSKDAATISLNLIGKSTRPVYVIPPVAYSAKDITYTGFVANWNNVEDASGYYLTVYSLAEGQSSLTEGFDKGLSASTDWTIKATGTTSSSKYSGAKEPSIEFSKSNEYIETEEYLLPASSLSFYIRSLGENKGGFVIQGLNEVNEWKKIDSLTVGSNLLLKDKTYAFNSSDRFKRFRFTYVKGTGSITFDDVTVSFDKQLTYKLRECWIPATTDTVTNLAPDTEYLYRVRASDKTINYENITNPSNTISLKTLAYPSKTKLHAKVNGNGELTVYLPTIDYPFFVYDLQGKCIKAIAPQKATFTINDLKKDQIYILKSNNLVNKIFIEYSTK